MKKLLDLLCLSPAALVSRHVKVEYRYFLNNAHMNKELYLIMCRPTSLPPELQNICRSLLTRNRQETEADLRISRRRMQAAMKAIREHFEESGLTKS